MDALLVLLALCLGLLAGAAAVYLMMSRRASALNEETGHKVAAVTEEMNSKVAAVTEEMNRRVAAVTEEMNRRVAAVTEEMNRRVAGLSVELAKKSTEVDMLKTTREQLQDMGRLLADAQASKLKDENRESMGAITQPLRDAISEIRKAISDNTKDRNAQSASLREQLRLMMESNREIGEKAQGLVNVLRRDNKISGNMGEIILGDLLASQGLTEGLHYEVQARLRDEAGRPLKHDDTGREMQPDVILHYPQGQDVIIDSKVSLVAYERYVNAERPEEKARALQEHIRSVRQHVSELAKKDYSKYVRAPREAVDFVIMFVPFESSLQLALANDPTLWRDAFEHKVFITGEQNLLGILHMIHLAWVQNQQAESQQKVFGIAEQLLDRLGDFIQRYNKLGEHLEMVRRDYESAGNKLFTGRQSVVQKGRELVDLGAKENANRRIPKAEDDLLE